MSFAGDLHTFDIFDLLAWVRAFRRHGCVVATVAVGGTDLYASDIPSRVAIIIGNEGAGK